MLRNLFLCVVVLLLGGLVLPAGSIATPDDAEESEALSWALAEGSGSPGRYERYLADFPDGICSELAQARLEEVRSWEKVRDSSNYQLLEQHIKQHPHGRVTREAIYTLRNRFERLSSRPGALPVNYTARFIPLAQRKNCSIRSIDVAKWMQENLFNMTAKVTDIAGEDSGGGTEDMFTAQQADMSETSITEGLEKYKNICADIGFKPGTERFGECVLKLMEMN